MRKGNTEEGGIIKECIVHNNIHPSGQEAAGSVAWVNVCATPCTVCRPARARDNLARGTNASKSGDVRPI